MRDIRGFGVLFIQGRQLPFAGTSISFMRARDHVSGMILISGGEDRFARPASHIGSSADMVFWRLVDGVV